MRGSAKERFGIVRTDALGVNPVARSDAVIATRIVEDETEAGDRMETEAFENEKHADPQEASAEGDDHDEGRKLPAKNMPNEVVADAEEDNAAWPQPHQGLPRVQQQPPLRPKPVKEDTLNQAPQAQSGFPSGMLPQAAGLLPAELSAAMTMNQSLLPVGGATAVGPNSVAPNMPLGWAALAALQQGLGRAQVSEPPQAAPMSGMPQTLLYTVGFGIDPRQSMHSNWDATEAAVRALRDAMERSTVRLPPNATGNVHRSPFQIHVKIGVPPREDVLTRAEPMIVDMSRIASVLPRSIPILPVDVVVGGLAVSGKDDPDVSICTAVACVTVQTNVDAQKHAWERAAVVAAAQQQQMQPQPAMDTSPWHSQEGRRDGLSVVATAAAGARVDSMEMLARISEEVRERPSSLGAVGDRLRPEDDAASKPGGSPVAIAVREESNAPSNERQEEDAAASYKKLPPGVTAKNNKRQFVQHKYHDHSLEKAPSMAESPMYSARGKSVGTAFPVKLHEMLSQIENDGYSHIISWLPHGRCFKIHKQQEFLDVILPNYCQMTKKSSFLRQLNLYGFNRLSAGPDKGAYYHELFLRGMQFLCKRMVRMKVNGNGIRAAGNPDSEPNFYSMPSVPRDPGSVGEDGEDDDEYDEEEELDEVEDYEEESKKQASRAHLKSTFEHVLTSANKDSTSKTNPHFGNTHVSFPLKLQSMLDKLEADGNTNAVSWQPHGRAFIVHDQSEFVRLLMPEYFRQTKYSSFQRQLHMYSFQRITAGRDKGAYYHESFLRGKPRLAQTMTRTRINGKGTRKPGDPSSEPDFYSQEPIDVIPHGTVVEIPVDLNGGVSPSDDDEDDYD